MDLVNQDKFKNWLLIILVVLNIITVSIIWMQAFKGGDSNSATAQQGESKDILSKALKLDNLQAGRFDKIRTEQRDLAKRLNDSLDTLKKSLADELFKANPDTSYAYRVSIEIGYLQSRLEMNRFKHFADLMSISTPEQKEKLKPVILDVFSKKPVVKPVPVEHKKVKTEISEQAPEKIEQAPEKAENENFKPEPTPRNEQKGPSINEKIEKYSNRLKLTGEQVMKLRALLENSKNQEEKSNRKRYQDAGQAADMKAKNRELEDEAVMKILDENQKKEFKKMDDGSFAVITVQPCLQVPFCFFWCFLSSGRPLSSFLTSMLSLKKDWGITAPPSGLAFIS